MRTVSSEHFWDEGATEISEMIGKVFADVQEERKESYGETYRTGFTLRGKGEQYRFYHNQDCCETVTISEVDGDTDDLIGSPITMAEVVVMEPTTHNGESLTVSVLKLATVNGYVTVKWHGESNGYYSEIVSLDISRD